MSQNQAEVGLKHFRQLTEQHYQSRSVYQRFARFGVPSTLISDNAAEFVNKEFQQC